MSIFKYAFFMLLGYMICEGGIPEASAVYSDTVNAIVYVSGKVNELILLLKK